ncbi:hypothetical protein cand_020750 [Cryptosporidium andersoni]|uniref:Uncharacterized protein n=1 Tax=Cryptosporidium andersoni TaxID=117008 RepID=A0A1J4MW09_9CRYT|nr:hypothetical protein cand_020750 [Cryptosporidium andersoni]
MLADWIIPVIVTLSILLFISLMLLLWTLLRSSHYITSISRSQKSREEFMQEMKSNLNKNPNQYCNGHLSAL